jgi:hypothetical protein
MEGEAVRLLALWVLAAQVVLLTAGLLAALAWTPRGRLAWLPRLALWAHGSLTVLGLATIGTAWLRSAPFWSATGGAATAERISGLFETAGRSVVALVVPGALGVLTWSWVCRAGTAEPAWWRARVIVATALSGATVAFLGSYLAVMAFSGVVPAFWRELGFASKTAVILLLLSLAPVLPGVRQLAREALHAESPSAASGTRTRLPLRIAAIEVTLFVVALVLLQLRWVTAREGVDFAGEANWIRWWYGLCAEMLSVAPLLGCPLLGALVWFELSDERYRMANGSLHHGVS